MAPGLDVAGVARVTPGTPWVICEHGDPYARAAASPLGGEPAGNFPHEPLDQGNLGIEGRVGA